MNPHQVTKDFEKELCSYTGAPYAVAVNSCTMALLLATAWAIRNEDGVGLTDPYGPIHPGRPYVEIPKRTYVSVPMSIIHAGAKPVFRDEDWRGAYQLKPYPVWDSARWFRSRLYTGLKVGAPGKQLKGHMVCVSFHWSKTLGIQQGGAILLDNQEADAWLRRARFDGRTEGVPPSMDKFTQIGWHCYMSPEVAAEGLMRLSLLPQHNDPLPNDDYPDLSQMPIFQ
jgi:dTDP-4-amino-4,6-dideoxygalactose transaminase